MSLTPLEEKDALTNLVKSPGWLVFLQHARQEWGGEMYGRRIKLALGGDLSQVPALVKAVDYANDEIGILLDWPATRVKDLTPRETVETAATTTSFTRGGR
jgi:hypothetical protein